MSELVDLFVQFEPHVEEEIRLEASELNFLAFESHGSVHFQFFNFLLVVLTEV